MGFDPSGGTGEQVGRCRRSLGQGLPNDGRIGSNRGVRGWGILVSVVCLGAVIAPAVIPGAPDSFPLSTYPMFSSRRPAKSWIATAIARRADGTRVALETSDIASSEPMQAVATLRRALAVPSRAAELCRTIASRVAGREGLREVELRWEQYPTVEYFRGETDPLAVRVVTRCPIESRGS